jgi:hypothetical protein
MRYPFNDDDMMGYVARIGSYVEEFKDNVDDTLYEVRPWSEHKWYVCDLYWKRDIFMSKLAIAIFGE